MMANIDLGEIRALLPEELRQRWDDATSGTIGAGGPATICLLGAFSVGKSSLLNLALGSEYLPHALEETTAAPTFVEFGESVQAIAGAKGRAEEEVPLDELGKRVRERGADRWFTLKVPSPWLEGVRLVDLPGLGSKHAEDRAYTEAQVRASDAVVYLLFPKGPSREDLEVITRVSRLRKDLLVVVTRCGEPESEKPNLTQYAEQIRDAAGVSVRMIGTSTRLKQGADAVVEFVSAVSQRVGDIRSQRFLAEASPVLESAVAHLTESLRNLDVRSEQDRARILQELLERKRDLLAAKQDMLAREDQERQLVLGECDRAVAEGLQALGAQLQSRLKRLPPEVAQSDWEAFSSAVAGDGRDLIDSTALRLEGIAKKYGQVRVPPIPSGELEIAFPMRPPLSAGELLDGGARALVEEQLRSRMTEIVRSDQALSKLPGSVEDVSDLRTELQRIEAEYGTLATAPLPVIEQRVGGNGMGRIIGRVLGETADTALMFVSPAGVAAKITSVIGKGAKAAKVAKTAARAFKVVKGLHKGLRVAASKADSLQGESSGFDKLEFLEMVSAGYWGEKIGGMFDPPEQIITATDPNALRERNIRLESHRHAAEQVARRLEQCMKSEQDRASTQFMREQAARDVERLKKELEDLKERTKAEQAEAESEAARRYARDVRVRAEQLADRWGRLARRHCEGMVAAIQASFKQYWATTVASSLESQVKLTEELERALSGSVADVESQRQDFAATLEKLRGALSVLQPG